MIGLGASSISVSWSAYIQDEKKIETYQEKIFGLFERLHSKSKYEGTGLGLAICKKIVSRHSGDLWAKSELGNGASFFVKLPIDRNK